MKKKAELHVDDYLVGTCDVEHFYPKLVVPLLGLPDAVFVLSIAGKRRGWYDLQKTSRQKIHRALKKHSIRGVRFDERFPYVDL